jgi:hypothetical protein
MIRAEMSVFMPAYIFFALLLALTPVSPAQEHDPGNYPEVLRGEVRVDLEPIYGGYVDREYPLDADTARRRALDEAALFYSAMIYGWSFHYDIGEQARQIPETFELTPVASIPAGDPGLRATDVEIRNLRVRLWTDYHLSDAQRRRLKAWRAGTVRNAQALGYGPPGTAEMSGWGDARKAALEDAARAAVRAMLRGSERNRPREAAGFICLASFPGYYVAGGRWAVSARFRAQVTEIIPFAAY